MSDSESSKRGPTKEEGGEIGDAGQPEGDIPEVWEDEASEDGWETVDSDEEDDKEQKRHVLKPASKRKPVASVSVVGDVPDAAAAAAASQDGQNGQTAQAPVFSFSFGDNDDDDDDDDGEFGYSDEDEVDEYNNYFDDYDEGWGGYNQDEDEDGWYEEEEGEENELYAAIVDDDRDAFNDLLDSDEIDLNEEVDGEVTPLVLAIQEEKIHFVRDLLDDPRVDVNLLVNGKSPLHIACEISFEYLEIVKIFLMHREVELELRDPSGCTAFEAAALGPGFMSLVAEWFIASGRVLPFLPKENNETGFVPAADLIKRYFEDPKGTRIQVQKELGVYGESPLCGVFFFSFIALMLVRRIRIGRKSPGRRFWGICQRNGGPSSRRGPH